MSYFYGITYLAIQLRVVSSYFVKKVLKRMAKTEKFDSGLQDLSAFLKAISHPARLAILLYLSETKACISGDISNYLPLSRSTVFQHLQELKALGLIHGEIDGLKVNYCLCGSSIDKYKEMLQTFFDKIDTTGIICNTETK